MNTEVLNAIRDASHPEPSHSNYDVVLRNYWCNYINIPYPLNRDDMLENERYDEFFTGIYAKEAFWGAIGHDAEDHDPPEDEPNEIIDLARSHLLDYNFPDYLSLEAVFAYMNGSDGNSDSQFGRGLSLGSILYNVAMMCDMLWYFDDGDHQEGLAAKLDSLADYTCNTILPNFTNWCSWEHLNGANLPTTGWTNGKLRLIAALGYAGCVLKDVPNFEDNAEDYYNTAKGQLFEYLYPDTYNTFDDDEDGVISGYMDACFGDGSGLYKESFSYYSWSMEFLTTFFTAAKRSGWGDNFYDNEIIVKATNENIKLHGPDFSGIPINDCWRGKDDDRYRTSEKLLEFYYHNDNAPGLREDLCWYFNAFRTVYNNEMPIFDHRREATIMSYNPNRNILGAAAIPDYVSIGSYHANPEFTVIRPKMNNAIEYNESIGLYVSHENTYAPEHNQDDQTSFSLFANGKYLLIDPGYRTDSSNQWLNSPYAHNLIVVNPEYDNETDNLIVDGYWSGTPGGNGDIIRKPPYGDMLYWPETPSNPYYRNLNPANRSYFLENKNISTAKIAMSYCLPEGYEFDTNSGITYNSYDVDIERNFFMVDDSYYIVYDKLVNQSGDFNDYRNQLHFAEYDTTSDNQSLTYTGNGLFTFHDPDLDDNIYLHGTLGAACDFDTYIDEELPMGWKYSGYDIFHYRHRRIRAEINNSNSNNEHFLTVLIPSESSTSPISDTLSGTGYYAVEVYDTSKSPTEKSYYAVSDSILDISFNDIDINSDAAFVGLTYRPGYQGNTKITQFIIADGDILFYNENDTLLVDPNSSIEEVIATYSGTELSVIVKSDDDYPQYRILRQGVDPDNFSSIGIANGENGTSNIKNLSYDSDYFYINWYDFSSGSVNLITPILVPYGDTLVIGNGVTVNCMNSDIKIEIEGEISIGDSVTFTSPDSVQWDGLYLFNTAAEMHMNNVTFERGKLHNDSRSLLISNSEFINSGIEQSGSRINVSETIFNSSNIFCERLNSCEYEGMDDVYITGCEFINFSDYYAVSISTYPTYNLSDNEITNCFAGFRIVESGNPKMCAIKNNIIRWNTNGIGICIYHSYADISGHNRIIGNLVGILGAKESSIKIKGNIDYPYQRISDNIYEEIVTDYYSLPYREGIRFNEIVDDEYIEGTRDQYLFVCKDAAGAPRQLNVEYNYWGEGCLNWQEGDGDKRFYPAELFDYIPVWDPGVPEYPEVSPPEQLYADADSLIQIEEYETAKIVYRNIIQLYHDSKFSIFSMRNLLPLETVSGQDFSTLKEYYLTEPNCNINDERTKLSQYLANYCSIKMEQYPEAISFFEAIISDPDTELDSVYAVIDAGYTYLLMENGGKSGYVGKMAELKPKSEKEFRTMRDKLLSELFDIKEPEQEEPNVEYVFELKYNYPNPFNTSTTISFSLPPSTQKAGLKIYNIKGQLVRELDVDTKSGIGTISWDGLDAYGKKVGSGIYFYKLTADKKEIVKKMVLMR